MKFYELISQLNIEEILGGYRKREFDSLKDSEAGLQQRVQNLEAELEKKGIKSPEAAKPKKKRSWKRNR